MGGCVGGWPDVSWFRKNVFFLCVSYVCAYVCVFFCCLFCVLYGQRPCVLDLCWGRGTTSSAALIVDTRELGEEMGCLDITVSYTYIRASYAPGYALCYYDF